MLKRVIHELKYRCAPAFIAFDTGFISLQFKLLYLEVEFARCLKNSFFEHLSAHSTTL